MCVCSAFVIVTTPLWEFAAGMKLAGGERKLGCGTLY